ncbi:hypothetical protein [Rhizobium ruizarguesonis]|uniref:hypothetical protein n=1 Tax=Rhizobium ruizarguesonis TaxID=2081791 RepID=UPI0010300864|nr:hypothetical protein [Rhizobium ruizarguesonis]TBD47126.1 hypothetical protein ELH17_08535 [Rhizobium ruizarguesonis]
MLVFALEGFKMSLSAGQIASLETAVIKLGGYDLEEDDLGLIAVPDWDGYPTRMFEYAKTDDDGTVKRCNAVMLNPAPSQVARWVASSSIAALGRYDEEFARKLATDAAGASGFQFLIRGVHLEDMSGSGKHTAYPFFDGVTVKLESVPKGWTTNVLTAAEQQSTIEATIENVTQAGKFARIQSTTREQYWNAGGGEDVAGAAWLPVVRQLYQSAWGADDNLLMIANREGEEGRMGILRTA